MMALRKVLQGNRDVVVLNLTVRDVGGGADDVGQNDR